MEHHIDCTCIECNPAKTMWEEEGDPSFVDAEKMDASYAQDPHRWYLGYVEQSTSAIRKRVVAQQIQGNGFQPTWTTTYPINR